MIDVTLSILALIVGGFVLELIAACPSQGMEAPRASADHEFFAGLEEPRSGNPS